MPELNFTPEQRAAIDTRGSTVLVSAAAGSGKTRVLTERLMAYLTDAENPVDIDRFLVITYTRAAAAELRSRILDGIYARIASDPENRRLRRQVALCARAEIGTIHSFCADFLRANCAALALAPDFQVADTERCASLRAAALEHTLERAYMHIDTDAAFRLLADTVGGGCDDARLGELVLTLYDKMQCHARPEQWAAQQVELLALDGVTEQDTKVAGLAHEAGKACIIVVNKWDLVEKDGKTMDKMRDDIRRDLSYMTYAPILFISAATGQRVPRLFEMINYVHNQSCMRISTGMLNNILADAQTRVQPPTDRGRRLKIYYMTQVGVCPPHFVVFCNERKLFHFSYQRYLENCIRNVFGLEGTPVIMSIREKGDKED